MDLNAAIMGFAKRVRPSAGDRAILRTILDPSLSLIAADRKVIDWLFVNLTADAYDAMPGGGEIVVTTANRNLDEAAATGMNLAPGAYVQIEFTAPIGGLEAGAAVSNIVHQLQGGISVHKTCGSGMVIDIYLPQPETASTNRRGKERGMRAPVVLVVSDDSVARGLTCDLLRDAGYEAVEASHGKEAEAVLWAREVDLMITDIVMREQDALETILTVRAIHPALKIIAVGESDAGYQVRTAGLLGADAVMSKPLTDFGLWEAVRKQIGDARRG